MCRLLVPLLALDQKGIEEVGWCLKKDCVEIHEYHPDTSVVKLSIFMTLILINVL